MPLRTRCSSWWKGFKKEHTSGKGAFMLVEGTAFCPFFYHLIVLFHSGF